MSHKELDFYIVYIVGVKITKGKEKQKKNKKKEEKTIKKKKRKKNVCVYIY
jgi:hypothetical protein